MTRFTHTLTRIHTGALLCISSLLASQTLAQTQAPAAPVASKPVPLLDASAHINPQWSRVTLPADKGIPAPTIDVALATPGDSTPAVRIASNSSYGHLLQKGPWPAADLIWQWRLDQGLQQADLQRKEGDDAALKVCVSFDHDDANVPWGERLLLGIARNHSDFDLPGATICYIWDNRYPIGTTGANPYSKRVRYMVLQSGDSAGKAWASQSRNLSADFLLLFGDETQTVPPVSAIAVGADTDNTAASALGWVRSLQWHSAP